MFVGLLKLINWRRSVFFFMPYLSLWYFITKTLIIIASCLTLLQTKESSTYPKFLWLLYFSLFCPRYSRYIYSFWFRVSRFAINLCSPEVWKAFLISIYTEIHKFTRLQNDDYVKNWLLKKESFGTRCLQYWWHVVMSSRVNLLYIEKFVDKILISRVLKLNSRFC